MVNKPDHYQGKIECIDIIDAVTEGLDGVEAFEIGCAVKYLYRYKRKGTPYTDLRKACKYINMVMARLPFEGSNDGKD